MKIAIQFGAGNIGRGFIGFLLSKSDYHVVFADINKEIINALDKDGEYTVEVVGETLERKKVVNVSSVSSVGKEVLDVIEKSSVITTAVGPNILKIIAPTIAKGIVRRKESFVEEYLNIIPCENKVGAGDFLRKEVEKCLSEDELEYMNKYVGFVNSAVDRIVPPFNSEVITDVRVEDFSEWIVDKAQFKGEIPKIEGMKLTDNLKAYTERKIFTLNTGHATTAYLGYKKGFKTIEESIKDYEILDIVYNVMEETGNVLIKKYGFNKEEHEAYIEKIINRFRNHYLKDDVVRVGREPLRKLGYDDRFIKPLRYIIDEDLEYKYLLKGIVAGLKYDYKEDQDALKIQEIIKENTLNVAIEKITGLDKDSKVVKEIIEEYDK